MVQDPKLVTMLGEKLRAWDGISMTHLYQHDRLQAQEGSMVHQPPWLWLKFPPAYDPVQVFDEVAAWVDAEEWMPGPDHASLMLRFVMPEVAESLAGLTITCADTGIIHFTTGYQRLDETLLVKHEIARMQTSKPDLINAKPHQSQR